MRLLFVVAALTIGACDSPPREGPRPNVLVISADSLRSDRLALLNSEGVVTPHLDALAARGVLYRNAWAVTPWTAPSMVSVFTGLYPPSHGVIYRDDTTPATIPTLPRILESIGYRLGNFTFFSEISYFRNLGLPPAADGLRHGRETEAFEEWLVDNDPEHPFFAWIHLLEPHLPYGASGYRATEITLPGSSGLERAQLQATVPIGSAKFEKGDREKLLQLYDQDVERLDHAIGEVLATVRSRGLENETIIVFVADHGEELLEDGWIGHASTSQEAKLTPALLRIPIVLVGPGVEPGVEVDTPVQQVDILPSLLNMLDLGSPSHIDGIPLPATIARPEPGWFSGLRTVFARRVEDRSLAFFDTSTGGNLTPVARVGERLQGVTDGDCLLVSHLYSDRPPDLSLSSLDSTRPTCEERRTDLSDALDSWREAQLEQRLGLLGAQPTVADPGPEAEAYPQSIVVRSPTASRILDWVATGGQIRLEWEGSSSSSWIEYRVGTLPVQITGSFEVQQNRMIFGPFPEGFWNDVAGYSPFIFRVVDPETEQRSQWTEFSVRATVE